MAYYLSIQSIFTLCAHAQQGQAIGRVRMYICMYIYVCTKVTAVSHLSPQKTSPNLVCWCVFAFTCHPTCLLLLVSCRSNAIPRYSIYMHTWSVPRGFMGSIYAHSYGQPILVRFSATVQQRTGLLCSLNSSCNLFPAAHNYYRHIWLILMFIH